MNVLPVIVCVDGLASLVSMKGQCECSSCHCLCGWVSKSCFDEGAVYGALESNTLAGTQIHSCFCMLTGINYSVCV